jgi:hypothetical protein
MAKRVAFTDQAKADIRAIPQPIAIQILRTLARFLESDEGSRRCTVSVLRTTGSCSAITATTSKSPASATAGKLTADGRLKEKERATKRRILGV